MARDKRHTRNGKVLRCFSQCLRIRLEHLNMIEKLIYGVHTQKLQRVVICMEQ